MADSRVISTFLELRDRMSGGLKTVGAALGQVSADAKALNDRFNVMNSTGAKVGMTLAKIGAALGGAALVKDIISINEQFENTSIRIAGTLKAFNLAPSIQAAQQDAKAIIGTIEQMAAALPGETEEYVSVFATALPKAIAAGMRDTQEIARFTSSFMALAASNMVDAQQAGMDLFRMLSGQAGADVRMFTVLAEKIGLSAEQFNKLVQKDKHQSVVLLQKALANYADQQALAADTYTAKMGELQSRLKEIKRLAGAELFSAAKMGLEKINGYLKDNRDLIVETGTKALRWVIDGFEQALTAIKWITENSETIYNWSLAIAGVWAGGALINGLATVITSLGTIRNLVMAINASGSAGIIGGVIGLAGAAGGAYALSTAISGGAAEVGKGFAGFGAGVYDTRAPTGKGGAARKYEVAAAEMQRATDALSAAGKYSDLRAQLERRMYGKEAYQTSRDERTLGMGLTALDALQQMYREAKVSPILTAKADVEKLATALGYAPTSLTAAGTAPVTPTAAVTPTDRARTTVHNDFRNSRFDIKQDFAEGFDPDRVAVAFASDLARVGEMKLQSGYAPLFSGR